MIKKLGKKGKAWAKARKELIKEFDKKGMIYCELCSSMYGLSFHHRNKRRYNDKHTFENVLLLCMKCHHDLEYDRKLTEQWFRILRDEK